VGGSAVVDHIPSGSGSCSCAGGQSPWLADVPEVCFQMPLQFQLLCARRQWCRASMNRTQGYVSKAQRPWSEFRSDSEDDVVAFAERVTLPKPKLSGDGIMW